MAEPSNVDRSDHRTFVFPTRGGAEMAYRELLESGVDEAAGSGRRVAASGMDWDW